jgi:arylsulfatase A-like enzyme
LAALLVALDRLDVSLKHLYDPGHAMIVLSLVALGGAIGLVQGLAIYGGSGWWQGGKSFLRPLRWKVARTAVLAVFLVSVAILLAVIVQRNYLYKLSIFQGRSSGQVVTPEQPNILLITIDALRADHLGMYGYDPNISPNMNKLSERGVVFDHAIVQAPWTGASVASFVTSLYPTELGIVRQRTILADMYVDKTRVTLAEVLQDAGYRTQAYVTNSIVAPRKKFDQGFDDFVVTQSPFSFDLSALHERTLIEFACDKSKRISYVQPLCRLFDQGYRQLFGLQLTWGLGWPVSEYGTRFLQQHKDERFFLWLYYVDPHARYDPPVPFGSLPSEVTRAREQTLRATAKKRRLKGTVRNEAELEALVALYDGEIVYVDSLVGQVLDELDRQGLTDRTMIIVNADHGEEFMDHGNYTHGHALYDELLRVPLIISGPVVETPGRRVETQVSMLDLLPTACEIAGAPVPAEAEGRSLVPLLRGEEIEELPAFSEAMLRGVTDSEKKSIRYNGFKLIYSTETGAVELYDLQTDPVEQVNLAEQEPAIVERMLTELQAWMAHTAEVAAELPRQRPLSGTMDEETRQQLRDVGY